MLTAAVLRPPNPVVRQEANRLARDLVALLAALPVREAGMADLGVSDVAFFLFSSAGWCTGRGEAVCPPFTVLSARFVLGRPESTAGT